MMKPKRTNYLTQEEIRAAIHKSKKSYCWYSDDRYSDFDVIVHSASEVTPEAARKAFPAKADAATRAARAKAREAKGRLLTPSESQLLAVDPDAYQLCDVVFRVMTAEHVPDDPEARGNLKRAGKLYTNFPPFKHYICDATGQLTEVGRSHWQGSLGNGCFSIDHGRLTARLGMIFTQLVQRYSTKGNWRGYTYVDEMRASAIETLCKNGLKFDESKSDNAFAYLTVIVNNAFTRVLNDEKKQQGIRDDLLQDYGMAPSSTRQVENELAAARANGEVAVKWKRPVKIATKTLTINGRTQLLRDWTKETGLSADLLVSRRKRGWTDDLILSPPGTRRVPRTPRTK